MRLFSGKIVIQSAYFLSIFVLIAAFSGCKKKDLTYTISGNIHDNAFNNNLEGATIRVTAKGSKHDDFTKDIITDASGNYTFSFKRVNYTEIKIEVLKTNYFSKSEDYTLEDFKINEGNTLNYSLDAKAWAKLHFTGDGTKTVKYFTQQGYSGCDECCPTGDQYLYNVTDNEILCINKGNTVYQIYYFVEGTGQHGQVDVVTVPFEYTELLVEIQ
jgi:hypothetical protein